MRKTSKRSIWLIMAVFFSMVILTGCNQYNNLNKQEIESIAVSIVVKDLKDIRDPHVTYKQKDTEALEIITKAINQAEKVEGIANVISPDYSVIVNYKDETKDEDTVKHYSIWLSDEHGSMMDMTDTHTIYTLPTNMIDELHEYMK